MPIMEEVIEEAKNRKVELIILKTHDAINILKNSSENTNAILHITC